MNLLTHTEIGDGMRECCHVYGKADWSDHILILGAVSPVWHGGDFCQFLLDFFLQEKQRVFVLDTIPFIEHGNGADQGEASIRKLARFIRDNLPKIDLIGGYALGGTMALKLANQLPGTPKILCLSGPGFIDAALRGKLQALIDLLVEGDLEGCLTRLSTFVAAEGKMPNPQHRDRIAQNDVEPGCRRMLKGFRFLLTLDARQSLATYPGEILCLLGQHSQLATTANLAIAASSKHHKLVQVPDAGMRILLDNREFTVSIINDWLKNGE